MLWGVKNEVTSDLGVAFYIYRGHSRICAGNAIVPFVPFD